MQHLLLSEKEWKFLEQLGSVLEVSQFASNHSFTGTD
jgi:hypothetical protein